MGPHLTTSAGAGQQPSREVKLAVTQACMSTQPSREGHPATKGGRRPVLSPLPQQAGYHAGVPRGPFPGFLLYWPHLNFLSSSPSASPPYLFWSLASTLRTTERRSSTLQCMFTRASLRRDRHFAVVQAPQGSVSVPPRPHESLTEGCFVLHIVRTRRLVNRWSDFHGRLFRLAELWIDSSADKWHKVLPCSSPGSFPTWSTQASQFRVNSRSRGHAFTAAS